MPVAYLATVARLLAREAEHDADEAAAYAEADAALREARAYLALVRAEVAALPVLTDRGYLRRAGELATYDRADEVLRECARDVRRVHAVWRGRRLFVLDEDERARAWMAAADVARGEA